MQLKKKKKYKTANEFMMPRAATDTPMPEAIRAIQMQTCT